MPVQCCWRRKLARRELRRRKAEAREAGKLLQDKQVLLCLTTNFYCDLFARHDVIIESACFVAGRCKSHSKQALDVKLKEITAVLENVQNQRNELRQLYKVGGD